MRSVFAILLFVFVANARDKELHSVDKAVDKLVNNLAERALNAQSERHMDTDHTTLAKPGNPAGAIGNPFLGEASTAMSKHGPNIFQKLQCLSRTGAQKVSPFGTRKLSPESMHRALFMLCFLVPDSQP